jgi:hypothetical protein
MRGNSYVRVLRRGSGASRSLTCPANAPYGLLIDYRTRNVKDCGSKERSLIPPPAKDGALRRPRRVQRHNVKCDAHGFEHSFSPLTRARTAQRVIPTKYGG